MRAAWLLLVGSVAFAAPPKPVRKPPPPGLTAEQLDNFVDAVIEDKKGELGRAINEYRSSSLADVPAATYNIADLYLRQEDYDDAVKYYKKYLEQAPSAPDREAVQKLIEQIQKTPAQVVVSGDDFDAVVFIDGKPAGASPLVTSVAEGKHIVDRIGPTSYVHGYIEAKPMEHEHVAAYEHHMKKDGNVILSSSLGTVGSWKDGDKQYEMGHRFTLPPGRHDTFYWEPGRTCSPISFEVPKDGLVYVFVDGDRNAKSKCIPIKVTAQKITFPKVKP